MASALASCSFRPSIAAPRGVAPLRRSANLTSAAPARRARTVVAPKALLNEIVQVAEEAVKVGDVAAPSWVLPVGVVVVTVGSILSGFLLKPGADASDDIKARDAKSGRWTK